MRMRRWFPLVLLAVLLIPASALSTGSLTIPNTIFTQPNPVPTSLLDQNWQAIATYINAREITFGVLASRPTAGTTPHALYFATDQNGGTFYADTGTAWTQLASAVSSTLATSIASLTISNNGTATASFKVLVGQATSDDTSLGSRVLINNTADTTKTLGAWAVGSGSGCLDTGSVAVFTFYHVFIINRIDTGVVDVLCSLSATAPTMPTSYTKKRRIGAIATDWSVPAGSIYFFDQVGNRFRWATTTLVVNNGALDANAHTATVAAPNGVRTLALLNLYCNQTFGYVSELTAADQAVDAVTNVTASCGTGAVADTAVQAQVYTNQAQQIRYRTSGGAGSFRIGSIGWIDFRGQE